MSPSASSLRAPVRHGRAGRRGRPLWRALLGWLGLALAVVVVSAVGVGAIFVHDLNDTIVTNAIPLHRSGQKDETPQSLAGAFNVLLVGADNSANQTGFGASRAATLNDVNILLHVNADHQSAVVLSLPRDLVVDHPACVASNGTKVPEDDGDPLNVDIGRGGLSCVVTTVESITGLDIPYAAQFTFEGTVAMADAVGGVPICTTQAIDDPDSGLKLPKGRSVISGRTALAYLRDRHGVGDGSDLARISSQQAYMSSLLRKAASADTLTDPTKLIALADATAKNVSLSTSMAKPAVLVGMMVAVLQVPLKNLVLVQFPTATDPDDTDKVIPNSDLASKLLKRIKDGTPVVLAKGTHGYSTVIDGSSTPSPTTSSSPSSTSSPSSSASPSASPTSTAKPISGLSGQTANEDTCSVASD